MGNIHHAVTLPGFPCKNRTSRQIKQLKGKSQAAVGYEEVRMEGSAICPGAHPVEVWPVRVKPLVPDIGKLF